MNIKSSVFQIYLYNLLIFMANGWRPFRIELTNISSFSSVDYIETNSSISSKGLMSLFFNVRRTISDFYAKVLIAVDTSTGIYDVELINKTINSCEFLKNPKYEPIAQVFYRFMTKYGSFPKSCPVTKKLYSLKDVKVDPENLPRIMPYKGAIIDIKIMKKTGNNYEIVCGYKIQARVK